jgi:hypothetical protein
VVSTTGDLTTFAGDFGMGDSPRLVVDQMSGSSDLSIIE